MYQRSKTLLFLAILLLSCSVSQTTFAKKPEGFRFPPIKAPYFQYQQGKAFQQKTFQFKTIVGKQAFVLFYFLPQHPHSITELKAYAMAAKLLKGRVQFMAVTKAQTPEEGKKAYAKMKELNISLPVILDQKGLMAYVMLTRRVPSYAVVTKTGYLRLARAGQLSERVSPHQTLLNVLMDVAQGKDIPFIRAPGYSPNPYNFIHKPAPLFKAPYALKNGTFSLGNALKNNKLKLLVFWSITCPHCQKTVPLLERYAKTKRAELQTVSIVIAPNKKLKDKLKTFVEKHKIQSTLLNDVKGKIFTSYRIMTVPTLYFLGAKGSVQAVYLGGGKNIGKVIDTLLSNYKRKLAIQKTTVQKPVVKKAVEKKAITKKKTAVKKPTTKKAAVKKAVVKKVVTKKKTAVKKATSQPSKKSN